MAAEERWTQSEMHEGAGDRKRVETASDEIKGQAKKATSFWTKVTEDWVFNFSGMLAYNYLTALAPILVALLAIGGLVLGMLSPAAYDSFVASLSSHFPAGQGHAFVGNALTALRKSAGPLLIIAVLTAIFSGSRLFVALENVFSVMYRVDVRKPVRQNIVAILMMLLFMVLAPLSFFAGSLPGLILGFVLPSGVQSNGFVNGLEGFVGGLLVAFLLFAAIYYIVPNRKLNWSSTWPGALAASALLNLYEILFPIYQSVFLKNAGLGSVAGLAVVILIFLYYVGFITLLGAEINAWASGLRPLGATLPELFRQERVEGVGNVHDTAAATRGGPQSRGGGSQRPQRQSTRFAAPVAHQLPSASHARRVREERQKASQAQQQAASEGGAHKIERIARPAAALTTVGAMLGAGAALALRRMSQPPLPSV